jgi:hypothetical protein
MSTKASNRSTPHDGKTARLEKENIKILVDAELKDVGCCLRMFILSHCCSSFSKERSYLYLRENSLESNVAFNICFGIWMSPDFVTVSYFDRRPYKKTCKWAPFPFCFLCYSQQPKLEIIESGCLVCCVKVQCCGSKRMVLMPFENMPVPCCCCKNRVTVCDNCFGLCGPITGNPIVYSSFFPQPTDPTGFVEVAQAIMLGQTDVATLTNAKPVATTATVMHTNPLKK